MAETFDRLNDAAIRNLVGIDVYAQGLTAYQAGKVFERVQEPGESLSAMVLHSNARAYQATVFRENDGLYAQCECGRSTVRPCLHVTALLIAWAHEPGSFSEVDEHGITDDLVDEYADETLPDAIAAVPHAAGTPLVAEAPPADTWEDYARREYARCLQWLTLPDLRQLAQRRGVTLSGSRKATIVETLATALSRRGALAEIWPALSPHARVVLATVALLRGQNGVYAQHLRDTVRQLDPKAHGALNDALSELYQLGLCFSAPYGSIDCPGVLAGELPPDAGFLPPATGKHEARKASQPLAFALLATRALLTLQAEGDWRTRPAQPVHPLAKQFPVLQAWPYDPAEFDALARERSVAQRVYGARLSIPPAPSPLTDAAREALARSLAAPPEHVDFVVRLLADLGLVHLTPGGPVAVDSARAAGFLRQTPLARMGALCAAWTSMRRWTEFDLVPASPGAPRLKRLGSPGGIATYQSLLETLGGARHYLLLLLRRTPARQWTDFTTLVARAHALRLNPALWPLGPGCYAELDGRPADTGDAQNWRRVYGAFATAVLAGPLRWMGLFEVACEHEQPAAFRLTDLGAILLGRGGDAGELAAAAPSGPALAFTPEGDLRLDVEAASPELVALLAQLCAARGGPHGGLLYRPTAAGASRVFEAGWDASTLLATFERAAGTPPPAVLATTLRAWGEHFGAVHLYRDVALLELADDYALGELLAGTSLAQHMLYRFNPRLIAVRPEDVESLREELVKKGYTPKVEA